MMETVLEEKYQDFITGKRDLTIKPKNIKGLFFGFFDKKDQKENQDDYEPDFITIDDLDLLI